MLNRLFIRICAATTLCTALVSAGAATAGADGPDDVIARFEGARINLAEDWGDAHACTIAPDGARCYRSEAEMDAAEALLVVDGVVPFAACSSKLRLYDETSWTGDVLELQTRLTLHDLSASGFDNRTSSYRVGACSARRSGGCGEVVSDVAARLSTALRRAT